MYQSSSALVKCRGRFSNFCEQVTIRDLTTILETLIDTAVVNKNTVLLVEAVRQALGRSLVRPLLTEDGKLTVATLDNQVEEQLAQAFDPQAAGGRSSFQPNFVRRLLEGIKGIMGEQISAACPTLLCGSPTRYHLRRLMEPFFPKLVVLSPAEVPATVPIQSLGVVH